MLQVPGWKPALRAEVLERAALPTLMPAWEDLCASSIEDNVYYSPRYAQALLENVESEQNIRFAAVWDGAKLVGMVPFTSARLPIPLLRPAGRAWQSKYIYSCTPLLDKDRAGEAAAALLHVLASVSAGEWIIPTVNSRGEACKAMVAALERLRKPWRMSGHFQRAALESGTTFDEHMRCHVSSSRRKDLARNRRRLEQLGKVAHECHRSGDGLDRAVSAFLRIEASGWKGSRGTALACDEVTRKFAIGAFTGDERNSICRADVLTLDGAPIAVSLVVFAGRTGFAVKSTYDETYRNCSAGLLLEVEMLRSFLSGNWVGRLDAATAGTHILDSLWPEKIEVADLIFSLSPRFPRIRLSAFHVSDQITRNVRGAIKRSLAHFRKS